MSEARNRFLSRYRKYHNENERYGEWQMQSEIAQIDYFNVSATWRFRHSALVSSLFERFTSQH